MGSGLCGNGERGKGRRTRFRHEVDAAFHAERRRAVHRIPPVSGVYKRQVEEVCRAFGVLPIMVGRSDKASTYASAEQMFLQHAVHTLGPWYACLEKSASRWLLSEAERRDGYYFKFNVNGLMLSLIHI